jgi:hypothetical protein
MFREHSGTTHFGFPRRSVLTATAIGLVIGLTLVDAYPDRLSEPRHVSFSALSTPAPASKSNTASQSLNWRWASEDGIHFIEFAWKPRKMPQPDHSSLVLDVTGMQKITASMTTAHTSGAQ